MFGFGICRTLAVHELNSLGLKLENTSPALAEKEQVSILSQKRHNYSPFKKSFLAQNLKACYRSNDSYFLHTGGKIKNVQWRVTSQGHLAN